MKKYRPLRELFISFFIFLLFPILLEYLSSDIEINFTKKMIVNLGMSFIFLIIYIIPTLFLFYNYNKHVKHRIMNYQTLVENDVDKIILVATKDKIKDRPSVYSLPYHMNFFYLEVYLKNNNSIFITSLDEYKIEEWAKDKFPNIKIEKKIDYYPTIR